MLIVVYTQKFYKYSEYNNNTKNNEKNFNFVVIIFQI